MPAPAPAPQPAIHRPRIDPAQWSDWRWQMRNRIRTVDALREWIDVSDEEAATIERTEAQYRWTVTPYYASLMDPVDRACPIRRQAIPSGAELEPRETDDVDPLGDTVYRRTNRVIHKYPDRIVLLVTAVCPTYCRHCTRKFHTTDREGTYFEGAEAQSFEEDFDYIRAHPEIRDVLLTGGDPLTYPDRRLEQILRALREIPHVEIIRFGTRFPVLLPQRITDEFCDMVARYHPVWLNTHFNHPRELTPEAAAACDRLLRRGVPIGNQAVLLKGVNDDEAIMRELMTGLLRIRVRPYYLFHCDNVTGVSHFATTLERGREIVDSMHGHLTGFAVPNYSVTTYVGKVPLERERVHADADGHLVEGYDGRTQHLDHL